jgi:hypothetical protein
VSSYHVRWMLMRDLPEVLEIETADCARSDLLPWMREHFLAHLRQRNGIGFVCTPAETLGGRRSFAQVQPVVGFMVYSRHDTVLSVERLAAQDRDPAVTAALYAKLADKLRAHHRLTATLPGGWRPEIRPAWWTDAARGLWLEFQATDDAGVLPVLADAFEEAGCDDERLLEGLRCRFLGPAVLDLATVAYFAEKPRTLSEARRAERLRQIADEAERDGYNRAATAEDIMDWIENPKP